MGSFGASQTPYVLVTGATSFIGAHVVDNLLHRGFRVRGATRSLEKGDLMLQARPEHASKLDFVQIKDFTTATSFDEALKDIEGVIHVASPFSYDVQDNEQELVLPAIKGVRSVLEGAAKHPSIERVVITSSFASVLDANRKAPPRFTYTAEDWNPLSYEESTNRETPAVIAYRGSKKFAELEAWNFVKEKKPSFEITTLCPPMTFGPIRHPISKATQLNESNAMLWKVASGEQFPVARVPFWIDVRDLAAAHVEALLRPGAANKRYTVSAPEKFSYQLAADVMLEEFDWTKGQINIPEHRQHIDDTYDLDGETAAKELGITYTPFCNTVKDLISQVANMEAGRTN